MALDPEDIGRVAVEKALKSKNPTDLEPGEYTVILEENHSSPVVNLRCYIKAGSIYEGEFLGAALDPLASCLLLRGLRTLSLRMRQHQEAGLAIARLRRATAAIDVAGHRVITDPLLTTRVAHLRRSRPLPDDAVGDVDMIGEAGAVVVDVQDLGHHIAPSGERGCSARSTCA